MTTTSASLTRDNPIGSPVREMHDVTPEIFASEILPAAQPVIMRGVASSWPAVAAGRESGAAVSQYLRQFDVGANVETMSGSPEIRGQFFYNEDITGTNFKREARGIGATLDAIQAVADRPDEERESLYIQAVPTSSTLPGFADNNVMPLVPDGVEPRIWIGTPLTVQAHFDLSQNIACLVAGRRRFTLFPPEQLKNLYIGPIERTLAGPPISMVRLEDPDFDRFPKFAEALEHAQYAELEPGDAIFIPYFWWHHVQSFEPLNVLVNYWWNCADHDLGSPFNAMLHSLLTIRDLPQPMREAWHAMYEHFIFEGPENQPVAHLPRHVQGGLGPHDGNMRAQLWANLANAVRSTAGRFVPRSMQR